MFCRLASITVLAALGISASSSPAASMAGVPAQDDSPLAIHRFSLTETPRTQSSQTDTKSSKPRETVPTAPLPPALWPGLFALGVFAAVKVGRRTFAKAAIH